MKVIVCQYVFFVLIRYLVYWYFSVQTERNHYPSCLQNKTQLMIFKWTFKKISSHHNFMIMLVHLLWRLSKPTLKHSLEVLLQPQYLLNIPFLMFICSDRWYKQNFTSYEDTNNFVYSWIVLKDDSIFLPGTRVLPERGVGNTLNETWVLQ